MAYPLFSKNDKLATLVIIVLTALWFLIAFHNFIIPRVGDWDESLTHQELQRRIVLKYHQFPLWNPYLCGGEPWLAHAKSSFISPFFLLILIFGTMRGVFITIFIQVFLGLLGMYCVSRYFKLGHILSLINALVFLSVFNLIVYFLPYPILNISLIPWIFMLFRKSLTSKKYFIYLFVIFSYLIYSGAYGIFILVSLIIAIDTFFYVITKKDFKFIISLFTFTFSVIAFSALKLIPLLELLHKYPRHVKLPPAPAYIDMGKIINLLHIDFMPDVFGPVLLSAISVLFFLAIITLWKKNKELVFMNIIFMLIFLGDKSPINVWRLFHMLMPMVNAANEAMFLGFILILSLSIGLCIEELRQRIPALLRRTFFYLCLVIFFFLAYLIFAFSSRLFTKRIPVGYNFAQTDGTFFQITGEWWKMFDSVQDNKGVVGGRDPIGNQIRTSVVPSDNPAYRGEYYLAHNSGRITKSVFHPEKIEFNLQMLQADILVINQNYFPGWRSSSGRVIDYRGLIGVIVGRDISKITVYYLPTSFIIGGIILLSFLSIVTYAKIKNSERLMKFLNLI